MFCPQCGTQANDTDAFCPNCGTDLRSAAPTPPPAPPAQAPIYASQPAPPTAAAYAAPGPYAGVYPKAPLGARFLALVADTLIAAVLMPLGLLLIYSAAVQSQVSVAGWILLGIGAIWELLYLLGRDGFGGAGFGKRLFGLVVVSSPTGVPAGVGASFVRQIVWLALGVIPVIGSLIEPVMVIVDKDGRRLGDKAAKTQVARATDVQAAGLVGQRGRAGALVAVLVALALMLGGSIVGGVMFASALDDAANGTIDIGYDTSTDGSTSDDATAPSLDTPEGTVDAFYQAVASGDFEAVVATFSEELAYYADSAMFEGWTVPSYRVLGMVQVDAQTANVDVQEYAENGDSLGVLTYVLVLEGDQWKIDDWIEGGVESAPDTSGDTATPPTGALNAESATDAVGGMLVALMNDDVDAMRSYATDYLQETYPDFFYPSGGAFVDFQIEDSFRDVDTWVVIVTEQWNSGPESVTYIVREVNGQVLVDDMFYE